MYDFIEVFRKNIGKTVWLLWNLFMQNFYGNFCERRLYNTKIIKIETKIRKDFLLKNTIVIV